MNRPPRIWDLPAPPGTEQDDLPVSPFKKVERDIADPPVPVVNKVEEDAKISVTKEKTRLPDSALKFTPPLQVKPAVKIWDLPAPPGTEDISFKTVISEPPKFLKQDECLPTVVKTIKEEVCDSSTKPTDSSEDLVKTSDEVDSRKCASPDRKRRRSRSRSRSRSKERHKKRRSRDRSRDRHRRSHSRSKHRRRRHSSSRSRSPSSSRSFSKYRHHRHGRRRRSRSRSHGHRSSYRSKNYDKLSPERTRKSKSRSIPPIDADINEVDMKIEEEEEEQVQDNVFKNDGTFLEMFKKLQEQQKSKENPPPEEQKKPLLPAFGKRRGGKVLKTGMVQKVRHLNDEEGNAQDAWAIYMKEVRKYKEACCDDDSKTRPLVK